MSRSCIVVGAGVSGLLAARELSGSGWRVVVLDKGRGVGGRMATRRVGEARCDHGAQFFTSRSERFEGLVREWLAVGAVREWSRGFASAGGERPPDGHPRYRGAEGMTSVPKHLARNLDVRSGERVVEVTPKNGSWRIRTESGLAETADALVMSPPAPQALTLVGDLLPEQRREALARISYDPCFAVMAVLDRPLELPEPGGIQLKGEPLDWISDNAVKGISPVPALTVHAGPGWSRENESLPAQEAAEAVLGFAEEHLGVDLASRTRSTSTIFWRYSWVSRNHPEPLLVGLEEPPLVFCGDGFGGAKVEGAALSGLAAADWLLGRGDA
ncbi:putative NAD/FAD-dependent oxidoreductase [Rubrobacter radiotolerans]|uniref:FAD-dependent oxidoreductase n=1 Tax=Rubrobacter radiotolerans TaxID=42256 RepID=A0A023X2J8_RUBRA|nr:FAD-dependent oxidoreductase [Rubrobacter radiotolerans]AHY46436.1 putative NAD/FAD-dependent oxidoreductase [Rubrobacter radiotolerans]MDX5893843.1 FAD-dependent oxidoreductase [Rubrobacter radiotolerans]SMC04605.1 hypothetical protein SAMN00767673_1150 [Rubrobacter radiotolerans DSM 5868]